MAEYETGGCADCRDDNTLCASCAEQIRQALAAGRLWATWDRKPDPVVDRMQRRYVGITG